MAVSANLIINSLVISALYALVAMGFTLIFGVGNVLNLAHGGLLTVGGFAGYQVANIWGFSPLIGVVAATVVAAAGGLILYLGIIKQIQDQFISVMIITLLIGILVQHLIRIQYGTSKVTIAPIVPGSAELFGISVRLTSVAIFVLSWAIIGAVFFGINETRLGKAVIASSMNRKGARLAGIDQDQVNFYVWIVSSALAGLGGVLLLSVQAGSWQMGTQPLILSFSIVIIGGLGSIRGSVVGAYIIGSVETATTTLIDPRLTGVSSLVLLIVVILARPNGLLGREQVIEFGAADLISSDQ